MKKKTIELYSFEELSGEAKERAIESAREAVWNDPDNFTLDECMVSLKAVADALDVRLTDWSIGPYNRGNRCSCSSDEEGNKAIARFLRVLMAHGYERPRRFADMKFPGICGFTGVCFDDDIVEAMWEALLEGNTLSKAFDSAADCIMRICEDDLEYCTTDEYLSERLSEEGEEIFMENGERY